MATLNHVTYSVRVDHGNEDPETHEYFDEGSPAENLDAAECFWWHHYARKPFSVSLVGYDSDGNYSVRRYWERK